jgi:hypothetical protein
MKKLLFVFIIVSSCATTKQTMLPEDELFLTRKYAGNLIEYKITQPDRFGDPWLIWLKTTLEPTYGIISAYGKDCKFTIGERVYIRRIYVQAGIDGYWLYQIESDSYNKAYRLSQFQYGSKVLVQTWF